MNQQTPYISHCGFCEQGLLRFARCRACGAIVALCDECDLIWTDISAVSRDPKVGASGAHPNCPECGTTTAEWSLLGRDDVEREHLANFASGDS